MIEYHSTREILHITPLSLRDGQGDIPTPMSFWASAALAERQQFACALYRCDAVCENCCFLMNQTIRLAHNYKNDTVFVLKDNHCFHSNDTSILLFSLSSGLSMTKSIFAIFLSSVNFSEDSLALTSITVQIEGPSLMWFFIIIV